MESSNSSLSLPDLTCLPRPIELCEQGNFKELFRLYDLLQTRHLKIDGYGPNDYLLKSNKRSRILFFAIAKYKTNPKRYSRAKNAIPMHMRTVSKHNLLYQQLTKNDAMQKAGNCYKPIFYAAAHGELAAVRTLVEKYRCSPEESEAFFPISHGIVSPLEIACFNGHFGVVKYLFDENHASNLLDIVCGKTASMHRSVLLETSTGMWSSLGSILFGYIPNSLKCAKFDNEEKIITIGKFDSGHADIIKLLHRESSSSDSIVKGLTQVLYNGKFQDLEDLKFDMSKRLNFSAVAMIFLGENHIMLEALLEREFLQSNAQLLYLALHYTCSEEIVLVLVNSCKQNPFFEDVNGIPLLNIIIECYSSATAKFMFICLDEKFRYSKDSFSDGLLHYACKHRHQNSLEAAKFILGEYPNAQSSRNSNLQIPLHFACESKGPLVELVMVNCDVNSVDRYGQTPMHAACIADNFVAAEKLVISGRLNATSLIKKCDNSMVVPLHHMCMYSKNFPALLKYLPPDILMEADQFGNTLLHIACMRTNVELDLINFLVNDVKLLISTPNSSGMLPLHILLLSYRMKHNTLGCEKTIHRLCDTSTITAQDCNGHTPLDIACYNQQLTYCLWQEGAFELINVRESTIAHKLLVSLRYEGMTESWFLSVLYPILEKSNVCIADSDGNTLLHLACALGNESILEFLLKFQSALYHRSTFVDMCCIHYGIEMISNASCELPLHLILRSPCRNLCIISSLITPNSLIAQDVNGDTPLHVLSQKIATDSEYVDKRLLLLLCSNFPYFSIVTSGHKMPQHLNLRVNALDLLSMKNNNGISPLHFLISCSCFHFLKCLFSFDCDDKASSSNFLPLTEADIVTPDEHGTTPLHRVGKKKDESMMKYLLQKVKDIPRSPDWFRHTLLHYCIQISVDVVRMLHLSSEDVDKDAMYKAIISNNLSIVKYFHEELNYSVCGEDDKCLLNAFFISNTYYKVYGHLEPSTYNIVAYLFEHCIQELDANFLLQLACNVSFEEIEDNSERIFVAKNFSLYAAPFSSLNISLLYLTAAWYWRVDLMEYLVREMKVDPHCLDDHSYSALKYMCHSASMKSYFKQHGNSKDAYSCAQYVIKTGLNPFKERRSIIFDVCRARNFDILSAILKNADIDYQDEEGNTPLLSFMQFFSISIPGSSFNVFEDFFIEASNLFLQLRCNIELANYGFCNVLHYAFKCKQLLKFVKMIDCSNLLDLIKQRNFLHATPLDIACKYGNLDVICYLLESSVVHSEQKLMLLIRSIRYKKYKIVKHLVKTLLTINECTTLQQYVSLLNIEVDSRGNTSLHFASQYNATALVKKWLKYNPVSSMKSNKNGDTPLHTACMFSRVKIIQLIVSSERNSETALNASLCWERVNNDGDTPLHIASYAGSIPCIIALSPTGLSAQNRSGDTALHIVCKERKICAVHYLITRFTGVEAAMNIQNEKGEVPFLVALKFFRKHSVPYLRLKSMYKMAELTRNHTELLLTLCQMGKIRYSNFAMHCREKGSRLDVPDDQGKLPLHYAARMSLDFVKACASEDVVNAQDSAGNTPLHIACKHGKYNVCKYLINEVKCCISIPNEEGKLPLHEVCSTSKPRGKIVSLLLKQTDSFQPTKDGQYPLHLLCQHACEESFEIITLMIEVLKKVDQIDTISITDKFGNLPLHYLCKSEELKVVKVVETIIAHTSDLLIGNDNNDTPLHLACHSGNIGMITLLIRQQSCDDIVDVSNKNGDTPLHVACRMKHNIDYDRIHAIWEKYERNFSEIELEIKELAANSFSVMKSVFEFLISEANVTNVNSEGDTPLHILLQNTEHYSALNPEAIKAKFIELMALLVFTDCYNICNSQGNYPIHLACLYQDLTIVKLFKNEDFLKHTKYDRNNVLHVACSTQYPDTSLVEFLLKSDLNDFATEKNKYGNLPLHLACKFSINKNACELLAAKCDINTKNNEGNTPLHLLLLNKCEYQGDILKFMFLNENFDFSTVNNNCETVFHLISKKNLSQFHYRLLPVEIISFYSSNPIKLKEILKHASESFILQLFLTENVKIVELLIEHDIDPTPLYKAHRDFFDNQLQPLQIPIKILFVGDTRTGKTTLVNSLKREAGLEFDQEEPERTAGVIPNSFKHAHYGEVTAYDFAGHREYYASHEAVMQSILHKSPPIILLLTKLTLSESEMTKQVLNWIAIVKNRLQNVSGKAHLIIVCSHEDCVDNPEKKIELYKAQLIERFQDMDSKMKIGKLILFVDAISMDCRLSNGTKIEKLVNRLSVSCKSLRCKGIVHFNAHCLLVFLTQHFKSSTVTTTSNIYHKVWIEKRSKKYYGILPSSLSDTVSMCKELAANDKIMMIKTTPWNSFVILDKAALLTSITGKILAPEEFTIHQRILSGTGIVSFSTLKSVLSQYDTSMIQKFLLLMEYCYEVNDEQVKESIFKLDLKVLVPNDKYLFFPSLITSGRPDLEWIAQEATDDYSQFGWVLQCTNDDTFTPNFIQIMLLRLIFGSTKIKAVSFKACKIGSISHIWKSGLSWSDGKGVQAIVDVVDTSRKIFVFMRSKNYLNLLKKRASLIFFFRELRDEILPQTTTKEYFFHFTLVREYFASLEDSDSDDFVVPMGDICQAIREGDQEFVLSSGSFSIKELTLFDPYLHMCSHLLQQIIQEKSESEKISDVSLSALSDHLHTEYNLFEQLLNLSPTALTEHLSHGISGPTFKFARMLRMWRDKSKRTYGDLRHMLDSISIFKGITHQAGLQDCSYDFCTTISEENCKKPS